MYGRLSVQVPWPAGLPDGSVPIATIFPSVGRAFSDWTPEDLDQIFYKTCADLYGFDPSTLVSLAAKSGPTVDELKVPLEGVPAGATSPGFYM